MAVRSWHRFADDLETHFNPRLRIPDAEERLIIRRRASAAARARMRHELDLRYGAGPRQVLDLFHPAKAGSSVLVFVHGGFWRSGDKSASSLVAEPFVQQGIPTFVLNYDLCPAVSLARIVEEIEEGLAWIAGHASDRGYSTKLFLFGHSAGAHLCAMALSRLGPEKTVIGAALASGLFDLEPLLGLSVNNEIRLKGNEVSSLSPGRLPVPLQVPLLLSIGGHEAPGWRSQTEDYFAYCLTNGATARLFECADQDHMSLLDHHLAPASPLWAAMLEIMTHV